LARKILLADDSVTAQNMGRKILADAGYEVITVNNGSAALKKIAELKPDLIVLDVYMPGYSGLEVCQRLKDVGETARIPVLLTVGKLEPFKTDEAKRVRADGYIVKPFEASELLAALSKLEDKIVPRAESSKPGRFARATAAIDEARAEKSAAAEDDAGWKNRISFPSKAKPAIAEGDADDSAIYNPVNKDLRTVVDYRPDKSRDAAEKEKVDLGALAPEGLPKDVTPEEIAALAAAAAQVQGKILESRSAESHQETAQHSSIQSKIEAEEANKEEQPVESAPDAAVSVTFAEQAAEPESAAADISHDHSAIASGKVIEMPSAILESRTHSEIGQSSDEPVTIAAAAGAVSCGPASRWTAVSVALAPEDNGLSLEQEMQQAYAAFAAAETGHSAAAPSESSFVPDSQASSETAVPEAAEPIPAIAAPEAVQTLSAVADTATEVMSAAVKQFETVASSYVPENASHTTSSSSSEASHLAATEASAFEASAQPTYVTPQESSISAETASAASSEAAYQDLTELDLTNQNPTGESLADQEQHAEELMSASAEEQASEAPASPTISAVFASEMEASLEKKDPDMAATTAAAWASWRRSREGGAHATESSDELRSISNSNSNDAAMAVAAGAENSPEDVTDGFESDPAIASIVDSVLAGLRPKIVEEISRKLGKKK